MLWISKYYHLFLLSMFCFMVGVSAVDNQNDIAQTVIKIPRSKSYALNFPKNIGDIYIEDPKVLDLQILGPKHIRLFTLELGKTKVLINDRLGSKILEFDAEVIPNLEELEEVLREVFPHLKIHFKSIKNIIFVSGKVPNPKTASEIIKVIKAYIHSDDQIMNNLEISMPTQVMIKVKIAEVKRNVTQNLGIDWAMFSHNRIMDGEGGLKEGFGKGFESAVIGKTAKLEVKQIGAKTSDAFPIKNLLKDVNGTSGSILSYTRMKNGFSYNISAFLDAMASESLATILAEPTLVTLSGQTASFNVGGENPYQTTNGNNSTNVEFKQYGISLSVTPTILSENLINLKVEPDISQPSTVTDAGVALETRKVSTTVELADGQSIVIAGLLKTSKNMGTTSSSLFSKIPIIGGLFKAASDSKEEVELVVVVTAYIVKPFKESVSLPTDALIMTSPGDQLFNGKLNATAEDINFVKQPVKNQNGDMPEAVSNERLPIVKDYNNDIITNKTSMIQR